MNLLRNVNLPHILLGQKCTAWDLLCEWNSIASLLDKVHLHFCGQVSIALLSVFYNLKYCKIARSRQRCRFLQNQITPKDLLYNS